MRYSKDIFYSTEYFYFILKFLGLALYRFDRKLKKFQTSLLSYFGLLIAFLLWIGMTWIAWLSNRETIDSGIQSSFLDKLWQYQYQFQRVCIIFIIVLNFYKKKNVETFLNLLVKFDQKMKQINWNLETTHLRLVSVVLFVMILISVLCIQIMVLFDSDLYPRVYNLIEIFFMTLQYIFSTEFYLMITLQFILSTFYVNVRLKALEESVM